MMENENLSTENKTDKNENLFPSQEHSFQNSLNANTNYDDHIMNDIVNEINQETIDIVYAKSVNNSSNTKGNEHMDDLKEITLGGDDSIYDTVFSPTGVYILLFYISMASELMCVFLFEIFKRMEGEQVKNEDINVINITDM